MRTVRKNELLLCGFTGLKFIIPGVNSQEQKHFGKYFQYIQANFDGKILTVTVSNPKELLDFLERFSMNDFYLECMDGNKLISFSPIMISHEGNSIKFPVGTLGIHRTIFPSIEII